MAVQCWPTTGSLQGRPLTSDSTNRYAAWYGLDQELYVGKQALSGGAWQVVQITGAVRTAMGLPVVLDAHAYITLNIMGDGRLLLVANNKKSVYHAALSTNPGDITAWGAQTLPGVGTVCTYPLPLVHPDGSVRMHLVDAPDANRDSGFFDVRLWDAPVGSSTFGSPYTFLKGVSVANAKGPGLVGDDTSVDSIYNWSGYVINPFVQDVGGGNYIEHWAWVWRVQNTSSYDNVKLSYVQYRSATQTWHNITGTQVTLPIDPVNTTAVQTGVDTDAGEPEAGGYTNGGGITLDNSGNPHIVISRNRHYHIWWNGAAWVKDRLATPVTNPQIGGATIHSRLVPFWMRGKLWFLGTGGTDEGDVTRMRLWARDGSRVVPIGGEVPTLQDSTDLAIVTGGNWENCFDTEAYRLRGTVEVLIPAGNVPKVWTFPNARAIAA